MANKIFYLDNFTESLASVYKYKADAFDGEDTKYKKMMYSLKNIVKGELTERQRLCLWLYYGKMMKMREIAGELGICVSSVSRHIKKGKSRIEKTMKYYF